MFGDLKVVGLVVLMSSLALIVLTPSIGAKGLIKGGFYKVESRSDNSVLTATWNGWPREVTTDEWKEAGLQEWRVRLTTNLGKTFYLLRNEFVKDNEVNKKELPGTAGQGKNGKGELVATEWTFTPVPAQENTFTLSHDGGCLKSNGQGRRISVTPCQETDSSQQWHFEFLFAKQE